MKDVYIKHKDGTLTPAEPMKMPWYVRLELWVRKALRRGRR